MPSILLKAAAFFKKDFLIDKSYRVAFFTQILQTMFPLFSVFFMAKLVGGKGIESIGKYGGDYFSFAAVGVSLSQYFIISMRAYSGGIRRQQVTGVLEVILNSRTSPITIILLSPIYEFVSKIIHVLIVVMMVKWIGNVELRINAPSASLALVLSFLLFSGFGMLSAGFAVAWKRGDPVDWLIGTVGFILAGVFFPVEFFPNWLQMVSRALPITYSIESLRMSMLMGKGVGDLLPVFLVLAGSVAVILPAGVWFFCYSVKRARRNGGLSDF